MHGRRAAAALAILAIVAIVYWPVRLGDFIWDDRLCFHDAAWLRTASWTKYLFRGFCDWTEYFRPLAVALYALQVHVFDSAPGPMHLVSLALHLVNTCLVGILARRLQPSESVLPIGAAMAVYGLHPVLIEPVFWIGCQYEMLVTTGTLLGLLANTMRCGAALRAFVVAVCFLLAAGAKESAVAFPLLLVIFDLGTSDAPGNLAVRIRAVLRRQWAVYLAVLVAGVAYLALRYWAIGAIATPLGGETLSLLARFQKAALAYVSYWRLLIWPMTGLSPIHEIAPTRYSALSVWSVAADVLALAIIGGGLVALYRKLSAGMLILAVTVALLPVLHLVPIAFNESLYHERYAQTALAAACSCLPMTLAPLWPWLTTRRLLRLTASAVAGIWLILAIFNIRATLPLWSDELALWQWAARVNPDSVVARQHLLAKYMERGDRARARALADALVSQNVSCPVCMLSIAYLALGDGDAIRAEAALARIRASADIPGDPLFLQEFIMAQGELSELQNDPTNAAAAYRDAIDMDPADARPRMNLAYLQLRQGELAAARATADAAFALYAPDERGQRRREFENAAARAGSIQ